MTRRVILATRNLGKVREMRALLAGLTLEVLSLEDVSGVPEVVEDGRTFLENALKKARAVAEATGLVAIADDSGLEVDALGGAPGIHSARYAGGASSDAANNAKLLAELAGVPRERRTARFRCVLVAYDPSSHRSISVQATCEGGIALAAAGAHGFGYDPVFLLPELGRTMAEVGPHVKNSISHRARALARLREELPRFLEGQGPCGSK